MTTCGHAEGGQIIDDAMVGCLAENAERGFPGVKVTRAHRGGRPRLGKGPSELVTVRVDLETA